MGSPVANLPANAFENLLVVSATVPPEKVESVVERRGGDPRKVGVVPVTGSPDGYDGPLWTVDPADPSDLTGISMRVSTAMEYVSAGGWIVFDNVNVLLMYGETEQVYRLLDSVATSARKKGARGAYCTVRGAIADDTYARLVELFDATTSVE